MGLDVLPRRPENRDLLLSAYLYTDAVPMVSAQYRALTGDGTMVGFAYATEFFTSWYSGNPYEVFTFRDEETRLGELRAVAVEVERHSASAMRQIPDRARAGRRPR